MDNSPSTDALGPVADDSLGEEVVLSQAAPPVHASTAIIGHSVFNSPLAQWIALSRPATLLLGFAPALIALTLLWANGASLSPFLAMLLVVTVVLTQAGSNVLEGYVEFRRATRESWNSELVGSVSGEHHIHGTGIYPLDALGVSVALFVLASFAAIPLALIGGVVVGLLCLFGLAVAIVYSSTPFPLKRLPTGELASLLAFGPAIVALAVLSQGHQITPQELFVGFALGAFAMALVEAGQMRDVDSASSFGPKPTAQLLGIGAARGIYTFCLVCAYVLIVLAALSTGHPVGVLAAFLSVPVTVIPLTGALRAQSSTTRQMVVRQTLRAYAVFCAWLFAGLVLVTVALALWPLILNYFA